MPMKESSKHRGRFGLGLVLLVLPSLILSAADLSPIREPETVGLSSARLERLAHAIKQDVDHGRMPGAVVAIARKGKLAYYESFGFVDKAAKRPMPKDAIFALASMTKPMVAVATLMLVEQGDLLLNDPIGNYLPQLKDMKVATPNGHRAGAPPAHAAGHAAPHGRRELRQSRRHAAPQAVREQAEERGERRRPGVSAGTRQAAAALSAGHAVGIQPRPRRRRASRWRRSRRSGSASSSRSGSSGRSAWWTPGSSCPASKAARIAKPLPVDPDTGRPTAFRMPVTPWKYDCGGGCASGTALDYLRFAQMLLNKGTLRRHADPQPQDGGVHDGQSARRGRRRLAAA